MDTYPFSDLFGPFPDVLWTPDFLAPQEADELFVQCRDELHWEFVEVVFNDKPVAVPRGLAWFGDVEYRYFKIRHAPRPMPVMLRRLGDRIEAALAKDVPGTRFNSVMLNYYRDGNDSIGMHADEGQLGRHPVIASVSLGGVRTFRMQHKHDGVRHNLGLAPGSLLVMKGDTQEQWKHGIDKEPGAPARINLTYRFTHPN